MKSKYFLTFPADITNDSVTYKLIKKYDLKINIVKAQITAGQSGNLLIEFEDQANRIEEAIEYLRSQGITVEPMSAKIKFDSENCVHCGACTAVCFSGALSMNKESWEMEFDQSKCVACKLCVDACPLKLFEINS